MRGFCEATPITQVGMTKRKKNMKIIKKGMRVWITAASMFSFLVGWVFFAHANKPAPLQVSQPTVSAPVRNQSVRTFNSNSGSGSFPFSFQNQAQSFSPRLRTGGS